MRRLLILLLLTACGGGGGGYGGAGNTDPYGITATGPGVLSASPLALETLVSGTPLGSLNPPGHTTPTDHVYLHFVDAYGGQQQANDCRARPVYAPGAGVVMFILQTEAQGDTKLMVQMTKTFYWYLDHVLPLAGIQLGTRVTAGQQIATTTGRCPSIDLGVIDTEQTAPGLLNLVRYGEQGSHAASPYRYFSEPLRAQLYAKVRLFEGVPADKDGRIGWGVAGSLAGDWFHASLSATAPANGPDGWPKSLSFAYDWYSGAPRLSIGGTLATPGVLALDAARGEAGRDPSLVGVAQGLTVYRGSAKVGLIGDGWVLVQMLEAARIRIEFVPGNGTKPSAFTAAAQEYLR